MKTLDQFETHPPLRLLAQFAWPAILSLVANSLYNAVDRAFVGQLVGTEALSAVSVVFPLSIGVFALGAALGAGTSTLVSLALGRKDHGEAESVLTQTLGFSAAASVLLALAMLPVTEPLLRFLSTPEAILAPARDFFFVTLIGLPFLTVSISLGTAIRSQGRAKTSLITGLVGIVANTLLCAVFVGGWGWGLPGSAWATVVAQVLGAAVTVGFYFTPLSHLRFRARLLRPRWDLIGRTMTLGLPAFLFQTIFVAVFFVLNAKVQEFGAEKALAAVGVINTLSNLFYMPVVGLIQGALPLFGYYQGAGQAARNRQVFFGVFWVSTAFLAACTAVIELFPEPLLSVFTRDPVLLAFCVEPLRVFLLLTPVAALQLLPSNYFQALGRPAPALVISLLRPVFLVAAVLVLPLLWGFQGFLWSGPLSDAVAAAAALVYLVREPSLKRSRGNQTDRSVDSPADLRS